MNFNEYCREHGLRSDVTKALTVRQPWAYLLACGFKTVENRSWPIPKNVDPMQPIAIHAHSKLADDDSTLVYLEGIWKRCPKAYDAIDEMTGIGDREYEDAAQDMFSVSAVVGVVWFSHSVDFEGYGTPSCVRDGESMVSDDFFDQACGTGPSPETKRNVWLGADRYAWVAAHAVRFLQPTQVKGRMNVWSLPDHVRFGDCEIAADPSLCHAP